MRVHRITMKDGRIIDTDHIARPIGLVWMQSCVPDDGGAQVITFGYVKGRWPQ